MGEVAVARGEEGMEVRLGAEEEDQTKKMVRWEKFLPQMALRVLLVEPDDSTSQIIAALLRKCSYRVAAVPDGLKAWETLKRKASEIDLILTEVELPSISGFSLLSLIMEHDICKNIPVIMMSSHDSTSMALKCILKGAADFLIKPVRRNELRNLWQHVWRRNEISRQPQNMTFPRKHFEATSENTAESNHSSGSVASRQKNNEGSEKWSEAQSTCTSPFLEAESAYMQNMQGTSDLKSSSNLNNIDTMQHEESSKLERESVKNNNEMGEKSMTFLSQATKCNKTFNLTDRSQEQCYDRAETENQDEVLRSELSRGHPNINPEIHGCNNELVEPSRGAIDLIATFKNFPDNYDENFSLNGGATNNFNFNPQLELSLRRDFPGSSCKQATDENQPLNHSNTSAFSWYSGCKLLQPLFPTPSTSSAKVNNTQWNYHESNILSGNNVDTSHQYGGTDHSQVNMATLAIVQSGQVELQLPKCQLGPFPATGATSDLKSPGSGDVFSSMFYAQPGVQSILSPKPVCQKESSPFPTRNSFHSNPENYDLEHYHCSNDATCTSLSQTVRDKSKFGSARQDSLAADQSTSNSICHDTANHNNNSAYRSTGRTDGNATSAVVVESNPQSFGDSDSHNYDGFRGTDSHCYSQREATLTKFRQKRKDRCYEKKVRYQSRKRLAEQRPRVKGQFVRQVNNDHAVADASGGS